MLLLKLLPFAVGLCYFANTVAQCLGLDTSAFSYAGGMSLLPWLFAFLSSKVFGFCAWHRLPLWYALVCDCINAADFRVGLPISDLRMLGLHVVVAWLFMVLGIYLYRHGR